MATAAAAVDNSISKHCTIVVPAGDVAVTACFVYRITTVKAIEGVLFKRTFKQPNDANLLPASLPRLV